MKTRYNFIYILSLFLLWLIVAFDTASPDKANYLSYYERIENGDTYTPVEIGYWTLSKYSIECGLSFQAFIAIITAISILLISSSVLRYSKKPEVVLFFYFCYPFLLDVTQIRHLIAMSIFIFSVRYLEKYSIKNLLKYITCVIIACTMHLISFAFLLFLLVYIKKDKLILKISIIATAAMILFAQYLSSSVLMQTILHLRDADITYEGGNAMSSTLKYSLFFASLIIMVIYLRQKKLILNDGLYKIALVSSVFIPTIIIDFQYTRLFRACCIIFYILIVNGISSMEANQNKIFWKAGVGLIMLIVFIVLFGPTSGYFEPLTRPIFTDNSFFSKF